MRRTLWLGLFAICALTCIAILRYSIDDDASRSEGESRQSTGRVRFSDVTEKTGITFVHSDGSTGQRYIVETVSAGVATFDYDGDGLEDIYLLSGTRLEQDAEPRGLGSRLYRNLGNCQFTDVTTMAGIANTAYALGVAVGDYDGNGTPDLYITNYGLNVLYGNNGDGTFTDTTIESRTSSQGGVGAGACFLDVNADGALDLFAAKYLEFSIDSNLSRTINGIPAYVSPSKYQPLANVLFLNEGNGSFRDISVESGVASHASWGMGVVATDFDEDQDMDIFVCNDGAENYLFENDGEGIVEEVGLAAGLACDGFGAAQGSMGVDCGDFNNDGRLDFIQTSYQLQHAVLYENKGGGSFEDVSQRMGIAADTFAPVEWGVGLIDFDADGYRDIYIACGHLQDNVELYDGNAMYKSRSLLFMNQGGQSFSNQTNQAGPGMLVEHSSRGAAFSDLDNDGDVDVIINNSREKPTILTTACDPTNNWIQLSLVGRRSTRNGVGARVRVTTKEMTQTAEVHSGRGYQSHFGSRLHFGISKEPAVNRVEIHWPSGETDMHKDVSANQVYVAIEGQGLVKLVD